MGDVGSAVEGHPKKSRLPSGKREPRWQPDTDPLRSRVLYELTATGYQRRYGRGPLPSDLNREFPASPAAVRSWGPWNRVFHGKGLPRRHSTPQSFLMKKLALV